MSISCPHCRNTIEVAEEAAEELVCPACGLSLRRRLVTTVEWHPSSGAATDAEVAETCDNGTAERPMVRDSRSASKELTTDAVLGDYELLDKLGAGGMGVVYRARQKKANRIVALKLIRPDRLEELQAGKRQEWVDRFQSEAQAAALLEHDHIVTDCAGTPASFTA